VEVQQPAGNLLDLGGQGDVQTVQPSAPSPASGDPFAMLEGLEHPSQVPTNPAGGGPSPGLDIASLYGDSYPPAAPASDPFGLGGLDGPSPAPVPTYDFGLPPPAIGNQPNDPFGFAAAPSGPSPAPSKPSKASGGSVQALSPNLVPKTSNPKKDPFADLFS